MTNKANPQYKSTLFSTVFSVKENALEMYNALNGTAYDNPEEVLENGQYLHNSGSIFSRPKWRIYNVKSPFFLNVNGEQFSINLSGGETVVIDTDRMIAYSGVDVVLSKTTGNLPLLATGSNHISWTGDVDRVTIQKNERWV